MITKHFTYHAPRSVAAVVELLAAAEAQPTEVIGGGTWVVPEMTNGKRTPARVVDLAKAGLGSITSVGDRISLGATVTYRDLIDSPVIGERVPMLRTMALGITGGSQIWNKGTVGGSACYANPASDVPAVLVALEATMQLHGPDGVRECEAAEFFLGAFTADVGAREVLAEIVITPFASSGYVKFKVSESSWPIVTAAFAATDDGAGHVVVGGAEAVPRRFEIDPDVVLAQQVEAGIVEPWSDVLADGEYRKSIAGVIAQRAVAQTDTAGV